ncbi:hypothetical protein GCM10022221_34360 [Actinocorallia aurea]
MIVSARGAAHLVLDAVLVLSAVALAGAAWGVWAPHSGWMGPDRSDFAAVGFLVLTAVLSAFAGRYLVAGGAAVLGWLALAFALCRAVLEFFEAAAMTDFDRGSALDELTARADAASDLVLQPLLCLIVVLLWAFFPAGRLPGGRLRPLALAALAPACAGYAAVIAALPLRLIEPDASRALLDTGRHLVLYGLLFSALVLGVRALAPGEPRTAVLRLLPFAVGIAFPSWVLGEDAWYLGLGLVAFSLPVTVGQAQRPRHDSGEIREHVPA